MKVKELVSRLRKINGVMPVRFKKKGEVFSLLRNFNDDSDGWELFELGISETNVDELNTEMLKHYLDYCNKMNYVSYFGKEAQFDEYEIEVADKLKTTSFVWKISRSYIEKIDGTFCLILEAKE